MDYANMSHADLLSLRNSLANDDPRHREIAPFEHRAFAREWAQERPLMATASLPFAIPAYTAAKAVGAVSARSPASFDEMTQGYRGLGEGLLENLRRFALNTGQQK